MRQRLRLRKPWRSRLEETGVPLSFYGGNVEMEKRRIGREEERGGSCCCCLGVIRKKKERKTLVVIGTTIGENH